MGSNRWRFAALALLGLFTALSLGAFSFATLGTLISGRFTARAPFTVEEVGARVVSVEAAAAAAGLQPGDRLLAIGGQPYVGRKVLSRVLALTPGRSLQLVVARDEKTGTRQLTLLTPLSKAGVGSATIRLLILELAVLLPLFCALLGFAVALRRPQDGRAWLLLLLLISFASLPSIDLVDPLGWPGLLRLPTIAFQGLLKQTWGLWMLLFAIAFPERARLDQRWPWIKWALIIPYAVNALLGVAVALGASEDFAAVSGLAAALAPCARAMFFLSLIAVGGFFALLGYKSGTSASADARRRLRLLWAGASLSLTPLLLVLLTSMVRARQGGSAPFWMLVPALFALGLFPLTLAYVMVVDRALDVGVVLRQGLQYALARNAVLVFQVLLSAAVIFTAFSLASDRGVNLPRRLQFIAGGTAIVFLTRAFAARLRLFIDRRFFREALDTERVLTALGEDVRTFVEAQTLLDAVARRLADALHVPCVAAFLKRDSGYALVQAVGLGAPPDLTLGEDGAIVARLRQEGKPFTVYPEAPHHWAHAVPECEVLAALWAELLIPLQLKERLLGFLSLGPKLSEQAYSPADLRLLRSVGAQVALALDNTRLTEAVAAEVATRARMSRELEIAREVQERLFPQDLPKVPGLEYAGYCRPARGVGGDYYDFLTLSRACLGLAIGDVSGKGIPAALLMASLQASLRGQVSFGPTDLAEVMGRVNHLICDASSANRYATFFYAQFDPQARTLAYVNAGHNAPMLLRASGCVDRLDQGGPVVGLIEVAGYQAAEVRLAPGDRLLAYTDGLSEAMNPADEEWGEERLLATFCDCDGLSAAETIRRLIAAADTFAAGAPQHDDMTVLVARFLP